MVSMPSLHFFRWAEQLKDSGHEVYWFDIVDGGQEVSRMEFVHQIVGWKLKYDFLGRYFIKNNFPKIYSFIQKFNEYNTGEFFEAKLVEIKPDVVHSFALQIACLPIVEVMNKYSNLKWIYSSWGSDIYFRNEIGIKDIDFSGCLKRINFLITDNKRDYRIALSKGFENVFLGVFPGNGGVDYDNDKVETILLNRKIILIKGYNDDIGKGINIVKALTVDLIKLLENYTITIFGVDDEIVSYIIDNKRFENLQIILHHKKNSIPNNELINMMGKSYIYIANSKSDGIPNALLEAMGMGAFPIQSNPGRVTEEVINHTKNGLLISSSENIEEIEALIKKALNEEKMIENAFYINTKRIQQQFNREKVKDEIIELYKKIYRQNKFNL
jgi:glycosyltransferase involved in cell wall biosynthesis